MLELSLMVALLLPYWCHVPGCVSFAHVHSCVLSDGIDVLIRVKLIECVDAFDWSIIRWRFSSSSQDEMA